MREEITESILEYVSKKANEQTFEEYLKKLNKNELKRLSIQHLVDDDKKIKEIIEITNLKKEELIDYIKENKKEIIIYQLEIIDKIIRKDLSKISFNISKNNYILDKTALKTILFISDNNIGSIEYNKENGKAKVFIPKEFNEIILENINKKSVIEKADNYNKFIDYIDLVLEAYGMISFDKIYEMYKNQIQNIDEKEFKNFLRKASILEENINIINMDEEIIVYGLGFEDEDEVCEFYHSQEEKEYKDYTKKQLIEIHNYEYLKKINEYKDIQKYIEKEYTKDNYLKETIQDLVTDYLYTAQLNIEKAKTNFIINYRKLFEASSSDTKYLIEKLEIILDKYPKWIKKGNK